MNAHRVVELLGATGERGRSEGPVRAVCSCGERSEGKGAGGAYLAHCQHQIRVAHLHGAVEEIENAERLDRAM